MTDAAPDPLAVLAALGFPGPARASPVLGGSDATIWRIERAGAADALRLLRPEQAAAAEREVAAMVAAAEAGVPVPRVHAAGVWRGRPAVLMDWCPGRPLADELRARPWRAYPLGRRFGRTQAAVHRSPPPAALADHPVPWRAWAGDDPAIAAGLRSVAPRPPALLHLDYHPLNVLVDGGRLSGVLDWANARVGDPRADLARTLSILRFAPLPGGPLALPARATRRAFEAGWRRGYRDAAGPVGPMAPFLAWAAAVMERDLAPRLGRPDLPWLTDALLADVRRWGAHRGTRPAPPAEHP